MKAVKFSRSLTLLPVCALFLWLAVRNVPFDDLFKTLEGASYSLLFPALILLTANVLLLALRWKIILGAARFRYFFWALGTGYLFNNIFPFRLGDLTRVLVMSHCSRLPLVQVTSAAVAERLADAGMILLALSAVIPFMNIPPAAARAGLLFGSAVLAVPASLLIIQRLRKLLDPDGFLARRLNECVMGLTAPARPKTALIIFLLSLAAWASSICMYWCVILCFHPGATVVEAAFMVVALSFALAVPSTPGFIGVFQLIGQQALLIPFGDRYSAGTAFCIAMVAHLTCYLYTTLLGTVGLWRLSTSFPGLGKAIFAAGAGRAPKQNTQEGRPS